MKRFLRNKRGDDTDASHVVVKWLLLLLLFAVIVGGIIFYIIKINKELPRMTQCGGGGLVSVGGRLGYCVLRNYACSEGVPGVGCPTEKPICCFDADLQKKASLQITTENKFCKCVYGDNFVRLTVTKDAYTCSKLCTSSSSTTYCSSMTTSPISMSCTNTIEMASVKAACLESADDFIRLTTNECYSSSNECVRVMNAIGKDCLDETGNFACICATSVLDQSEPCSEEGKKFTIFKRNIYRFANCIDAVDCSARIGYDCSYCKLDYPTC